MNANELDAAGIREPELRASYTRCRQLLAAHGKTYYLASLLLPPAKRPYIQAIYGFARHADEIVDNPAVDSADKAETLIPWNKQIRADLDQGQTGDPIFRALLHTLQTWEIPHEHVEVFLDTMLADLSVTTYSTYADLERYMYGAAATLGLQMTPVLEPVTDGAYGPMQSMGMAFQLTNILRDVGEDLDRGRVYLPIEDLSRFGVDLPDLNRREVTPPIRELLRFEVERARELYRHAHTGVAMLHPTSRETIRTSLVLYSGILEAIEAADYQIFAQRVRVGIPRRIRVAAPAYLRSLRARRRGRPARPAPGRG